MRKAILFGVALATLFVWLPAAQAATEEEIEQAIQDGLAWLVAQQEGDGSWPAYAEDVATTGLAVLKLCSRAYEQGYDSPFDPDYLYHQDVIDGLDYLFSSGRMFVVDISIQDHGNPDFNGNTKGVYADHPAQEYHVYDTGIVLSAIAATGTPTRVVNVAGSAVNGWTYGQVAQDMVDWLAYAQTDWHYDYGGGVFCGRGGWYYQAINNASAASDNSNSGYATLGLSYAEGFGSTIPDWVKTELDVYIGCIQDPVNGDANDGGSWYRALGDPMNPTIGCNTLKTGNLVLELLLADYAPNSQRVLDALDYLARHWNDPSGIWSPPGWNGDPAWWQAMFTIMKGLEYAQIDELPGPIDWYQDFADVIVAQQAANGSWDDCVGGLGNPVIWTEWALLTLEKVVPPLLVYVDIKPMSCPNPLNTNSEGVLPVAVLGTEFFDVTTIDPATIRLAGVAPIRWDYEDVATPFTGELCDCHELGPDDYMDMTFKFDTQEIVAAIEAMPNDLLVPAMEVVNAGPDPRDVALVVGPREYVHLTLTGMTFEGREIVGEDCVRVMWKTRGPHDEGDPFESAGPAETITEASLAVGYPGSFASGAKITFSVPEPTHVSLAIFDVAGRRVKTLVSEARPDGIHSVYWNGTDEAGLAVASGVYFIRMSAPGINKATKLIIVE